MKLIEDALGVIVSTRGNRVFIQGDDDKVRITERLILDIYNVKREGHVLRTEDIAYTLNNLKRTGHANFKDVFGYYIPVASKVRYIIPKTETQMAYIEAIRSHDIVVGIGPAGTGKTYIAMAMAIHAYMKKQVSRIILARPAVEAGERLGFLPGDIYEKVHPYLRPLYDALHDMMDSDKAAVLIEKGLIEIAPLAYMRGRTLKDAFVILDEAQNTTTEQMKMYLTRLGINSRTVITGDVTQIDLPSDRPSGLIEIEHVLRDIEGIRFVYFNDKDVVRHKLVQEIIKAYERHEKREK
ncbi:MAG: PhoH family protein [Nitrospirae bacterium]|nr:PhoH family protein [Nitrospirota bacterium]MBF0591077.1 PhoH family protein [Nitrospirota bacterium]